jgi:hypothetical protein
MTKVKYPRTMHLPWSPGVGSDDKIIKDLTMLEGCSDIVVSEKMDGENCTLYHNTTHARSLDSRAHESRTMVKNIWSKISHEIPEDFRICGENMYAKHSISYSDLESYLLVFNIWQNDTCLSWDDTLLWCGLLDLQTVPVLYRGKWDKKVLSEIQKSLEDSGREGFCVRTAASYSFADHSLACAKYVRKNHVQTSEHWSSSEITINTLQNK